MSSLDYLTRDINLKMYTDVSTLFDTEIGGYLGVTHL